jgi:hypothetical protein
VSPQRLPGPSKVLGRCKHCEDGFEKHFCSLALPSPQAQEVEALRNALRQLNAQLYQERAQWIKAQERLQQPALPPAGPPSNSGSNSSMGSPYNRRHTAHAATQARPGGGVCSCWQHAACTSSLLIPPMYQHRPEYNAPAEDLHSTVARLTLYFCQPQVQIQAPLLGPATAPPAAASNSSW